MDTLNEKTYITAIETGTRQAVLLLKKRWLSMTELMEYLGRSKGYVSRFIEHNQIKKIYPLDTGNGCSFLVDKRQVDQVLERLSRKRT